MSQGSEPEWVNVPDRGQWYERGSIVKPRPASRPDFRELDEGPGGDHEVLECRRIRVTQDEWLGVQIGKHN